MEKRALSSVSIAFLLIIICSLISVAGCIDSFAGKASVTGVNSSNSTNTTSMTTTTRDEITARFNKALYGIDDDKSNTKITVTETGNPNIASTTTVPTTTIPATTTLASISTTTTLASANASANATALNITTTTIPPVSGNVVTIKNKRISPVELYISVGENVTWVNDDVARIHMISASYGEFRSERMMPGTSFTYTFTQKGEFSYIDAIDSESIKGKIIVG